jgi:hypothetical protein
MAIIFPEGTQNYPAGTAKSDVIAFTSRVSLGTNAQNWLALTTGSYTKLTGTSGNMLVTFSFAYKGENSGGGSTRLIIGPNTYYGQFQWGGYGGYMRCAVYTFDVTGLGAGTHSWQIDSYWRGFSVLNPDNNDSGNNIVGTRSTIHFLEENV